MCRWSPSLHSSGLCDLSFKDNGVLEALTIAVSQPIQVFTPSSVSFVKSGASASGGYIHIIISM